METYWLVVVTDIEELPQAVCIGDPVVVEHPVPQMQHDRDQGDRDENLDNDAQFSGELLHRDSVTKTRRTERC